MRVLVVFLLVAVTASRSQGEEDYQDDDGDNTDTNSILRCECDSKKHACFCVKDHQCLDDGTMNYYGAGNMIHYRSSIVKHCSEENSEVCCIDTKNLIGGDLTEVSTTTARSPSTVACGQRGATGGEHEGDRETKPGEFPWMTAVFRRKGKEWKFRCGASLVTETVVLTAAHCVKRFKDTPESLMVRAGAWDLSDDSEAPSVQTVGVSKIEIHPDFDEFKILNDIAMLKVASAFHADENVKPVCVASSLKYFPANTPCIVTGWGHELYESSPVVSRPRMVTVPLVSRTDCQNKLRRTALTRYFLLHDSQVCAGGEVGKDACQGDGGGALVCKFKDYYFQVGIVSWGIGCGKRDVPGVYADVTTFYSWIKEMLEIL